MPTGAVADSHCVEPIINSINVLILLLVDLLLFLLTAGSLDLLQLQLHACLRLLMLRAGVLYLSLRLIHLSIQREQCLLIGQ